MAVIKERSIVTYSNPDASEEGNYACVFRVLEMRGDHVLVEQVWSRDTIKPTFVIPLNNLRPSFAEHPDVKVPAFVDFEIWQDTSWHNDITASVEQPINEKYNVKVWVYDSEAWKEAEPLTMKFYVCVIDNLEGYSSLGDEVDTEAEVLASVEKIKADVDSFIARVGWM